MSFEDVNQTNVYCVPNDFMYIKNQVDTSFKNTKK